VATSRLTWSIKPTVDLDEFDLVEIPKYFIYLFIFTKNGSRREPKERRSNYGVKCPFLSLLQREK